MFATIYMPDFFLQAALHHQPELRAQPVALLDDEQSKAVISQLNAQAKKAGVSKGMTATQGLARCLHLILKTRAQAQEKALEEILWQHAGMLSPYVEATAPGICTVQFTDLRNLSAKLSRIIQQLAAFEIIAQAGIAKSPDTSFLAAHLANPVLQIEVAEKFLAPLPIETLTLI